MHLTFKMSVILGCLLAAMIGGAGLLFAALLWPNDTRQAEQACLDEGNLWLPGDYCLPVEEIQECKASNGQWVDGAGCVTSPN